MFLPEAQRRNVGVIVRVPLASGLLTGKLSAASTFAEDDHRYFNRQGAAFDRGETFSGVDYDRGLAAVERIRALFPGENNLAPRALQWVLNHPAVSTVIPGASRPDHLASNFSALELPSLTDAQRTGLRAVYDEMIRPEVHHRW